jgi:uncharacterized membrane protein YcaP (DUF421 family)
MDIAHLFSFNVSPAELILRGSVMYWFLFLMFRFVLRRDAGALGIADILLVVLIADASQNAMGGNYETIAEGCVLVATLIGWNYLLDWASYKWEAVRRFAEPPPLLLIQRGRLLMRNLRQEFLTPDDVQAQLRQSGCTDISKVKKAYMESDGRFSVIKYEEKQESKPEPKSIPGA